MDIETDEHEPVHPVYNFGWWPEIAGLAGVCLLIWYLISFARGSI